MSVGLALLDGKAAEGDALRSATDQLIESLRLENQDLEVTREAHQVSLNNQRAISVYLRNDSPNGSKEIDWLVTVMRPEGLVYFVAVAPETDFGSIHPLSPF